MGNSLQQLFNPQDYATREIAEIGPFFRTPLTDVTAPLMHHDSGKCKSFESNYLDCYEAYGNIKGKKACVAYYHDFFECSHNLKQEWRIRAMMKERWRQYVKGQLGMGPVVPQYAEPPPMDCYGPENFENDN